MDFNGHMNNTAFLDYAADCRMLFFKQNGFDPAAFAKLRMGPVVFSDRIQYFSELFMYDEFTVALLLKQISPDGSRYTLVNEFQGPGRKPAARVESNACWLDLVKRKVTAPPRDLFDILNGLARTADFIS